MPIKDTDSLPSFVREMLKDFERKDARDQAELTTLQEQIRRRQIARTQVTQLYTNNPQEAAFPTNANPTVDFGECPLTQAQMRQIGHRRRIIEAIAKTSPGMRVRPAVAAKWMRDAGIFTTEVQNAAKSLARNMRRHPSIWEPQERGWFRFVGTLDPQHTPPEPPVQTDQVESTSDGTTDQNGPHDSTLLQEESSNFDDSSQLL